MTHPEMENPYAAPKEFGPNFSSPRGGSYEVRGKQLAIRAGALLPARCVKTNEVVIPGENGRVKTLKLSWIHPLWIALLFVPFGLFILIIICLTKTSRGSVTVYLSAPAIRKKRIVLSSILLVSFGLLALTPLIADHLPELLPFTVVGGIIGSIVALFSRRYLSATSCKDGWFLVKGFHRDFLRDIRSD